MSIQQIFCNCPAWPDLCLFEVVSNTVYLYLHHSLKLIPIYQVSIFLKSVVIHSMYYKEVGVCYSLSSVQLCFTLFSCHWYLLKIVWPVVQTLCDQSIFLYHHGLGWSRWNEIFRFLSWSSTKCHNTDRQTTDNCYDKALYLLFCQNMLCIHNMSCGKQQVVS